MINKVGIIGVGMVGGALRSYFEEVKNIKPFLYDSGKNLGSIQEANESEVIFICVPTPFDERKQYFDLSHVETALSGIEGEKIIVIKSTVLPGSTEYLQEKYPQHMFLNNPEFLTEAKSHEDMLYPDRQIVGYTERSRDIAKNILELLPKSTFSKIMPATEAEAVKYFGNTWLSMKVIFANQIYDLCQELGINYDRVKEAASADKRVGASHLEVWHEGKRGYAGRCLRKDLKAFINFANEKGIDLKLHRVVDEINDYLLNGQGIEGINEPSNKNKNMRPHV